MSKISKLLVVFSLIIFFIVSCLNGAISILGLPLIMYLYVNIFFIKNNRETAVFNVVFIFNFAILLFIYFYYKSSFGVPYFNGGSDDLIYEEHALLIFKNLSFFDFQNIDDFIFGYKEKNILYIYIINIIIRFSYSIFGSYSTLSPRIINAILLSISTIYLYRILINRVNFKKHRKIIFIVLLFGCFPLLSYISSHVYRDILISYLVLLIYYNLNYNKKIKFKNMAIVTISLLSLSYLRFNLCIVMTALAGMNLLKKYAINSKTFKIIILILSMISIYNFVDFDISWFQKLYSKQYLIEDSGISNIIFRSNGFLGYILRIGYLYINPVPMFNNDFIFNYVKFGTVIKILFFPILVKGIIENIKQRHYTELGYFLVLYLSVALTTVNIRQSISYIPFMFVFLAIGYQKISKYEKKIYYLLLLFCLIVLFLAYVILKI